MVRIADYVKRFFRRSEPPVQQPFVATLFPYRSPQTVTYNQLAHDLYNRQLDFPTEPQPLDSFTQWNWVDEYSFTPCYSNRRKYPS